jgi:hypothetical protein
MGQMRPEGLGKLINSITLSGPQPATFRLVVQFLNHYATAMPIQNSIADFPGN